jgi:hypothetical protein
MQCLFNGRTSESQTKQRNHHLWPSAKKGNVSILRNGQHQTGAALLFKGMQTSDRLGVIPFKGIVEDIQRQVCGVLFRFEPGDPGRAPGLVKGDIAIQRQAGPWQQAGDGLEKFGPRLRG